MNIKFFLIVLVALTVGCQGIEFIYDKSPTIKLLENDTQVIVSGDDVSIIKSQLNNIVVASTSDGEFKLLVTSSKTSINAVIKDNQTVSQIGINHVLNYNLQKRGGGCIISEKKISSDSVYNLKSSGYSFGTDLAKKETVYNNVEKNINDFFQFIIHNHPNLNCKNED